MIPHFENTAMKQVNCLYEWVIESFTQLIWSKMIKKNYKYKLIKNIWVDRAKTDHEGQIIKRVITIQIIITINILAPTPTDSSLLFITMLQFCCLFPLNVQAF